MEAGVMGIVREDAGLVPVDGAVELSEGPAEDFVAGFESDVGGFDFEADPFSGFREFAVGFSFGGVVLAPIDEIFPPVGAVIPDAVIPLEHDFLRRVLGVEPDVGKKEVAFCDDVGLGNVFE